ncbi:MULTISPECIES: TIGR03960 family B12-binding radical SAM protein [Veillonella]|uniref:TIGR03960 family B12-binding radical SAM protein n=1 Tax=Veillonella TaxID=29465 RepID=UPI0028FEFCA7|nr:MULTISPECIES: TIGR03960 family B12-binding radical SAM protein [Veillonella]MBS7136562.1 TIGR03960 family B12-binding radical SAM protein [Veillonella parvula]MDU2261860.1 TIGR03960 family B12-binding radical SAM protein [Veillonella parvula]MDU3414393.1 TIGR03960 family B12-binding radical SAM protein [Veillonella parvula]MDU6972582.1 TIGR03960 family B12-binding radical SAM protein [Veillonella sp.]
MNRKDLIDRLQELYKDEDSRVTVNPHAGQKVAIVYPNTYFVGMSNLGLHIIYEEINLRNDSVCERIFLPEKKELEAYDKTKTPLMSVETQRPMHQFDVVAFDVTFEMDYFHIPLMLRHGRVPIMGKDRTEFDPIVIAGGPCATFNPEPFADFIDAFIIGEGEGIVSRVLDIIRDGKMEGLDRHAILRQLADISGVYVPSLYVPIYSEDGEFKGYDIAEGVPKTIKRHFEMLTSGGETVVATNYTEFGAMYIIEVARGCGRHCRFCMAGYCFRVPRVRPLDILKEGVERAEKLGKKVGLMGAAISDYPEVDELVNYIRSKDMRYSCASLRADSLTQAVVDGLADSGQKTITIAPETGSERLRRVINKGISEEHLQNAATLSAKSGIQHMRLYIMIGLPTETDEDIEAIVGLAERTQAHMEKVGCKGRLTLSINPFIPKPFTPFQWMAMDNQKAVEKKLQYIKKALQKNRRIEVLVESPKEAYIQGVLARGDRRLGAVIAACAADRGSKSFKSEMKAAGLDMDNMNYRERSFDEFLPWSHLDMGMQEGYLEMEWKRSIDEAYTPPCAKGCKRCGVCK